MKLYYEDTGTEKPPLVLVAGLATDSVSWAFQKRVLGQQYRLITFDNRGSGRSPTPDGPYSVKVMSQDLLDLIDFLGLSQVRLLGHSLGGAICQQFALDNPDRVEKQVLACTFSHIAGRALPVLESWVDVLRFQGSPKEVARVLLPWLYTDNFFAMKGAFEASVCALEAHPYPMTHKGVSAQLQAIKSFDSRSRLSELKTPTLIMAAEKDLLIPLESSRALADNLPNAEFTVLPDAGHSCMLEKPDSFSSTALEFLGR